MALSGSPRAPSDKNRSDQAIRQEALEQAIRVRHEDCTDATILDTAKKFEDYMLNGASDNDN